MSNKDLEILVDFDKENQKSIIKLKIQSLKIPITQSMEFYLTEKETKKLLGLLETNISLFREIAVLNEP